MVLYGTTCATCAPSPALCGERVGVSRRSTACVLSRAAIEPGESYPIAAADEVVLDHQQRADALHPHPASVVIAVVVDNGVVFRCDLRLEVAVSDFATGRNGHFGFNVQLAAS